MSRTALGEIEEDAEGLQGGIAKCASQGIREGDALWADAHTVLGIATADDSCFLHHYLVALALLKGAYGVGIKEAHLRDNLWPHELGSLVHLGTALYTAATGHTGRKRIHDLLLFWGNPWAKARALARVYLNPGRDFFQVLKHRRAIDDEIANERKFSKGGKRDRRGAGFGNDGLHDGATGLPRPPIDKHGAGAAYLLEAS